MPIAKGSILVFTGNDLDQEEILTVPANGNMFVADSSSSTGWEETTPQLSSNIIAARSGNMGGMGASVFFPVTGVTTNSIVNANINAISNTDALIKTVTAATNGFNVLFVADPGVMLVLDYQIFIVAQ